jgi:hypothetical protein
MKTFLSLLILGLLQATISIASEPADGLPPNIEIVSQDSLYITVLDKNTGLTRTLYCPGEPKIGPGWEMRPSAAIPSGWLPNQNASMFDTCFSFPRIAVLSGYLEHHLFGDADRDGLIEIAALGAGYDEYIFEYTGHDSLYELQAVIPDGGGMDYGGDADLDGKLEMMGSVGESMTLFEAPDSFSLPTDSVYAWPWNVGNSVFPGGFTDLDGDGITEVSFRQRLSRLTILRCTGDNQYELACNVFCPDSLIDNYYDYVWGDLDNDGKNEMVWTGSMGWILTYENVAPDSYAFVSMNEVRERNADWIVGPADLDSDGLKEFYVMSAALWLGGSFFYGFESDGDNSFAQFWTDSLPGAGWFGGTLDLGDVDGDQIEELVICSVYWIAVYRANEAGLLQPVYLRRSPPGEIFIQAFVYDTNLNGYDEMLTGRFIYEYLPGSHYRGDMNEDCILNLLDVTYLVNYYKGMDAFSLPPDIYEADINGNCQVNGIDILYLVNFFRGGPPPIDRDCN